MKVLIIGFAVIAIIAIVGFVAVLSDINSLRTDVHNLKLAFEVFSLQENASGTAPAATAPKNAEENKPVSTPPRENKTVIQTAIFTEVISSPLLNPQVPLTLTVESVEKAEDGTVTVAFKVLSDKAENYSALSPRDFFEIVNLTGQDQSPLRVEGEFESIAPRSAVSGKVFFKIGADDTSFILRVGTLENARFYEFNFKNRSYKETVIG